MATIDTRHLGPLGGGIDDNRPYHETYKPAGHFRSKDEEFDSVKLGMWLFLTTEILLFSGLFVAYAIFRYMYPHAFFVGSQHLNWIYGGANTVILLFSSWTVASSIRNAQLNQQKALRINLMITIICGLAFLFIKLMFEYRVKYNVGLLPGKFYSYPFGTDLHEPLWWGIYWCATGIHATHVLIGCIILFWLWVRAGKGHFGPGHYNAVEVTGLYWHIVDMIWIFLFPLLYLIH
jgi:cytochrome c oxidase subunit 3